MFMQVVHIFDDIAFHGSRYRDIINQASGNRQNTSASVSVEREARSNTHLKWITYSQSPTPPECGQTGTPNLKWFHNQKWENGGRCSLCGHQEHAENLADACEATRVNLADIYRVRLEELFEQNPVMRMLARRNANSMRFQRAADGRVPKDIVRGRRLLNEPTTKSHPRTNCQ
jgi:hypothetical protein